MRRYRSIKYLIAPIVLLSVLFIALRPPQDKYFEIAKNLKIFTNIYKKLNKNYVDEIDPSTLMNTAIKAMMHSLDPYTVYYSENQIEASRFRMEGSYDGLGAKVDMIDNQITIVQPYKGYAADEAGLKAGDVIIEIEGKPLKGLNINEAKLLMQGVNDANLNMVIERKGEKKNVSIDREKVNIPNVPHAETIGEGIAYVNLTTFTQKAASNVHNAIKKIKEENNNQLKGIILDLRDNGGGLLSEAINLVNLFVPQGELVVTTRSKVPEWDKSYKTSKPAIYKDVPLVVLVNDHSASASEIVSGSIQDLDRGVLMGQKTYGKGLVQNFEEVGYNSRMKLTISKYYIPSGRCIQSVAYKDGEPVDIPIEKRNVFYTKGGRKVLDGGGVMPDILLSDDERGRISRNLKDNHIIFKFVNEYIDQVSDIEDVRSYQFKDYEEFLKFVKQNDEIYTLSSEKKLKQLEEVAKEEPYADKVSKYLESIKLEIQNSKESDLKKYKDLISELIAEEIVSRKEYLEGRVIKKLSFDPEVKEAADLLRDTKKYKKILSGK